MSAREYRFPTEAIEVAEILGESCVLPDAIVLDALKAIHKRNPNLSFRDFVTGVYLARTLCEAATRGLQS